MRKILILSLLFCAYQSFAQYTSPLNLKIYLAGNFGEIRPNHFHSGADIKTEGVSGKSVLAVADGYVSRISISPTGFGKALYITHNNGATSVYGHLEGFNKEISDYVRDEQYKKKSYSIELYPPKTKFPLKQGDKVAFSGNSGSSAAPHLHFELRDPQTQNPINLVAKGYLKGIGDTLPPRFITLYHIEIDSSMGVPIHTIAGKYTLKKEGNKYSIPNNEKVKIAGPSYFAVEVTDSKNGVPNTMGIYSLVQKIDGAQNFSFKMDYINFNTTRYVNTHVLYATHKATRYDVLRNYIAPNDKLTIYSGVVKRGVVTLADNLTHNVEMTISDDNKNSATLNFDIEKSQTNALLLRGLGTLPVYWDKEFVYDKDKISVKIPAGALYESILFSLEKKPAGPGSFSSLYLVQDNEIPLQNAITISITPDSIPRGLEDKLAMASLSSKGEAVYEGGSFKNGKLTVDTRTFGAYFVSIDTIPPTISPIFKEGANLSATPSLSVKIRDNFSGISSLNAYIDGAWALCEYDPKNNMLKHFFVDRRYSKGISHTIRIDAEDGRGNKTSVTRKFFY